MLFCEAIAERGSRFLHEFVAVPAAFEFARLDSAWSVGDFAVGDLRKHRAASRQELVACERGGREHRPGCQDVLTCSREADLPRLFVVQRGRRRGTYR